MKKLLFVVCITLSLVIAVSASAALLEIPSKDGMSNYNGYNVGPVGAKLDGATILDGVVCNSFYSTTYIPSSFDVYVSSLPDLTHARFGSNATAVWKYQQAAALLYEMKLPANLSQVGDIQFAIWNIFAPSTPDPGATGSWLTWAAGIQVSDWNFSDVRIYTASIETTNQEFMSGGALPSDNTPVPIPPTVWLLGTGLLGLVGFRRKYRK